VDHGQDEIEQRSVLTDWARENVRGYTRMEADREFYIRTLGMTACQRFLAGWYNLTDEDGNDVSFKKGISGVADQSVAAVPHMHRVEIATKVIDLLRPTKSERKNSGSSATSSQGRKKSGRQDQGESGKSQDDQTSTA
jgi:hypothetical protein